jgi:2-keto-4-pentenoate hydratase/2-oxohepta-3-ene-1,7-dioic acid hydratase in catechol pathway
VARPIAVLGQSGTGSGEIAQQRTQIASPDVGRADSHQTFRAHDFDTATSIGPFVDTDVSPDNLDISLRINGETASQGNTTDMVYGVDMIVSYISQFMTLYPGDTVFMGTPMGTPVDVGDAVEVEIEGIGVLKNEIVAPA